MDRATRLPGKIEVVSSKQCLTQRDLSLAYSPGVAAPSMEIARDPKAASSYTARSNLVAVVTNGTAVLGLGNIGPLAAKPVMEGKGVLFKKFANINVFDIELNAPTPDEVVKACQMLEPTVGGINLEDIKAPDCFEIEERLRNTLKIPIFHDDQHGTAIIVAAAFINALVLSKKKAGSVKVVFSGAGAAAIACANILLTFGVKRSNVILCDKAGVVHAGRNDLDPYKAKFAFKTSLRTLKDALVGADVFIGLSVGGVVTQSMVKGMAKNPMIFPMANPTPEIGYEEARAARPDAIVATGRSDFPNQVNNVLGFPSIFRGALDVEATSINEDMKVAAAKALAELTRQDVPDSVSKVYEGKNFVFGPEYIIPKPFDPRVLLWVAPAVAEAAMKSGVAKKKINLEQYREQLALTMDRSRQIMNIAVFKAKKKLRRIVFPEGSHPKILKAAHILLEEGIAQPILIGKPKEIEAVKKSLGLQLKGVPILDSENDELTKRFAEKYYDIRKRRGVLLREAERTVNRRTQFGLMMVEEGLADGLVSGISKSYPETIRPALQIIRMKEQYKYAAGLFIMLFKDRVLFFADTTVNIVPDAEKLAEIAIQTAEKAEFFKIHPRIALVSFSNFGSAPHPINDKIQDAVKLIRKKRPDLEVDGEMQADTAVSMERLSEYAFSSLKAPANILIFPSLAAGNIAYKLLQQLGSADVIGPILMGPRKPVHVLQQGASVEEVVRIATIAAAEANTNEQHVNDSGSEKAKATIKKPLKHSQKKNMRSAKTLGRSSRS
ncbi:MAG: NADP-dependent malic enzyme [Deltaproteobacteria bacterium]|nr:NADP-dependent malic enzyme [Deltaproteobacteria bacterium]